MSTRTHCWLKIACAALIGTSAATTSAQEGADEQASPARPRGSSLRAQLTASVSGHLLRSADPQDRLRAIRRLGGQRDYHAVQLLLQAIDDNPGIVSDPGLRLEAVRALSPFAPRDPVRKLLTAWATDTTSRGSTAGPLGVLAREQAAMALAASSNARAIEQLVLLIVDGGPVADRAADALIAHPPRSIEPLLRRSALESPAVVEVLGELGDLRAIPKLRRVLAKGDLDVQVAAAVALACLGDASGVKSARKWLEQDGSTHALRVGAARTLTLTRDTIAPRAVAVLLADPATRDEGLALAEQAPTAQLAPTLAGLLTIAKDKQRPRVLAALARAGGPLAVNTLSKLANQTPVDLDAAYALSQCRDPGVPAVVTRMLANSATRRAGARIGLVRVLERGEHADGLDEALTALAASKDAADRSVGVFGLVAMREVGPETYIASNDPVSVLAACRGALARDDEIRAQCVARLAKTPDSLVRDALAGTLPGAVAPAGVSTNALLGWAEQARVSAPVFGRALGARDDDPYRTRIERLLASGDPDMRAQVAIGLGRSPDASAASLLTEAYAFEPDASVRRAVVMGLAARQSAVGRRWLELAARLDPDEQVRSLARHALAGRRLAEPRAGDQVLWLRIAQPGDERSAQAHPVRIVMSNGFATVAVTAADGQILVPGLTPGTVRVRVAPPARMQQESRP